MKTTVSQPEQTMRNPERDALVRQAELIISNVLRGGVLLSAAIILSGVILFYIQYLTTGGQGIPYNTYPHTLRAVSRSLAQGNPIGIITLGLLILLATPVMRVAVSIVAFALERDWRYILITSLVLAILLFSFFALGQGGA
jgi:uncharacterized membrane protein